MAGALGIPQVAGWTASEEDWWAAAAAAAGDLHLPERAPAWVGAPAWTVEPRPPPPDRSGPWWDAMEERFAELTAGELARLTERARVARRRARAYERETRAARPPRRRRPVAAGVWCGALRAELARWTAAELAPAGETWEQVERRAKLMRSADWHANRARSLSVERRDLLDVCRRRFRKVRCGCREGGTGAAVLREVPVGCDQVQLCDWCRARHFRRWRRDLVRAWSSHLDAALAWWRWRRRGRRPGIYLITLTGPHSGSIVEDRRRLGGAWRALSKRVDGRWWSHYALTWEVTPGRDGLGHVHAHVAVLSSWVPYDELADAWADAMPGAIRPDVVSPAAAKRRAKERGQRWNAVESAAKYLSKYVTKGVDVGAFTGPKAAEVLAGFRGLRKFTTSRHFWMPLRAAVSVMPRPAETRAMCPVRTESTAALRERVMTHVDTRHRCKTCGDPFEMESAPDGIAAVIPGAVARARARGRWAWTVCEWRAVDPQLVIGPVWSGPRR